MSDLDHYALRADMGYLPEDLRNIPTLERAEQIIKQLRSELEAERGKTSRFDRVLALSEKLYGSLRDGRPIEDDGTRLTGEVMSLYERYKACYEKIEMAIKICESTKHKHPLFDVLKCLTGVTEIEPPPIKHINRECLIEFVKAYESLRAGADCAIQDSDVSNAFARAIEAVNSELRRTE